MKEMEDQRMEVQKLSMIKQKPKEQESECYKTASLTNKKLVKA